MQRPHPEGPPGKALISSLRAKSVATTNQPGPECPAEQRCRPRPSSGPPPACPTRPRAAPGPGPWHRTTRWAAHSPPPTPRRVGRRGISHLDQNSFPVAQKRLDGSEFFASHGAQKNMQNGRTRNAKAEFFSQEIGLPAFLY